MTDDSVIKKATSAHVIRASLIKFKASAPLTDAEIAQLRPHVLEWSRLARMAKSSVQDLFEAHRNMDQGELTKYIEAHPPTAQAIAMLLNIAVAFENRHTPSSHGKKRAENYVGAKERVLGAWKAYCNSAKFKSKNHFAHLQASKVKATNGKSIAASTIYRWLPKQ